MLKNWLFRRINEENNHILFLSITNMNHQYTNSFEGPTTSKQNMKYNTHFVLKSVRPGATSIILCA